MNLSHFDGEYPRLEEVLLHLQQPHKQVSPFNAFFSNKFSEEQVNMIRDLVLRSHGDVLRKSGGFYIEEHLAEVAELGEKFQLPYSAVAMLLLHDFIEDRSCSQHYSQGDSNYIMDRNYGALEQQVLNTGLYEEDTQVILTGCELLTKPVQRESNSFLNNEEYTPFEYKLMRSLGLIEGDIPQHNQFYAQIGALLDMYSNGNPYEVPREDLAKEDKQKFFANLPRNTHRLMQWAPLIDKKVTNCLQINPQYCIMNQEVYEQFIQDKLILRIEQGREMFDIRDDSSSAKNYTFFRNSYIFE